MSTPTVLVIEDYEAARKAMCLIVRSYGATAIGAADGEEALALAAAHKPDLIFCDIRMPRMDGFEFLNRLRATPGLRSVPVVAMSGVGSEVEVAHVESAGFAGHLMKPVEVDVVGAYVEALGSRTRTE